MPEGDTIYRTARTLDAALSGLTVTEVVTTVPAVRRLGTDRLVGQRTDRVEARGKHLLQWFAPSRLVLHSHLGMTGSWHTYAPGAGWHRPERQARLVLRTASVVAVAFNVPVLELLTPAQLARHPSIAGLGPDPLGAAPLDLAEARRRLDRRGAEPVGVALLNQTVLAGVGNVYANEVQFIVGIDPWTLVSDVTPEDRDRLLATAASLLRANVAKGGANRITTRPAAQVARGRAGEGDRLWVYGKAGRPCPRCGTTIQSASLGDHARVTYWCRSCQGPGPPQRRTKPFG